MKCDTCGKEVLNVKRIVLEKGYDRTQARAIYNCEECYMKKEADIEKHTQGKGK
ncbi:MAG: hypothetical protein Q7J67_02675 [bacterium]|nr:hypothetical protein [bacterium]